MPRPGSFIAGYYYCGFAKVRKATISFVMPADLSVCLPVRNDQAFNVHYTINKRIKNESD
jgi:hypothetical protein